MLHDHDDKFDNADEPEYHFSGDEDNDALEGEPPKASASLTDGSSATPPSTSQRPPLPSKRVIISVVIFLVLVCVVYKMVVPSSQSGPGAEINAVPATSNNNKSKMPMSSTMPPAMQSTPISSDHPPSSGSSTVPSQQQQPQQQQELPSAMPAQAPSVSAPEAAPATTPAPVMTPPSAVAPMNTTPAATPSVGSSMPQETAPATSPEAVPQAPATQSNQNVPALMVVPGSSATTTPEMQSPLPLQQAAPVPVFAANSSEAKMIELEAESARLLNQMNTEYTQKLNDFSTQNQALQDQMQSLNARVLSMETQLNQLVQALTRQSQSPGTQGGAQSNATLSTTASDQQSMPAEPAVAPRAFYTVQAIIPGRAWLKSENGDIVTVAEGDMIRDLGRVSKIDPYDGVVEVNTGSKTISLSYGTGG
jgi:hypothetical protein